MHFKRIFLVLSIFILICLSGCLESSISDLNVTATGATSYPTNMPAETPEPSRSLDPYDQMIQDEIDALVPYWDYDLSEYTPVFIDNDLIAIFKGDDWISTYELYPFIHWMNWNDKIEASANKSFLDNKDTLYIYNADGMINEYSNYTYDMYYFGSTGDIHLMLDYDEYKSLNPAFERLCVTTSNPAITLPLSVTIYKDDWKARYTLDIDGDHKTETVTFENIIENNVFTSEVKIADGENEHIITLYSFELDEVFEEGESLNELKLIGEGTSFKAIFMDINNDGVFEIITEEGSYDFHNYSYALYVFTENQWQLVSSLYYGD